MAIVWEFLDEELKKKIKGIMPKDWHPPIQIEPIEDIEQIMEEAPTGGYAAYISGKGK